MSPTISSPVCQEQLIEAGKLVDRSVENCVRACQAATGDSELLKQVSAAASVVSQALHDLLQHVRQFASRGEPIGRYDQATDTIMCVTESIFSSMGDAGEAPIWWRRDWLGVGFPHGDSHFLGEGFWSNQREQIEYLP